MYIFTRGIEIFYIIVTPCKEGDRIQVNRISLRHEMHDDWTREYTAEMHRKNNVP
jgi:hypothetical protein